MSRLLRQPGLFCLHSLNVTKCSYQYHSFLAVILYCIRHREPEPQPEPWNMIPPHTKPIPQNAPARSRNRTGAMLLFLLCKEGTEETLIKNPRLDCIQPGIFSQCSLVPSLQEMNGTTIISIRYKESPLWSAAGRRPVVHSRRGRCWYSCGPPVQRGPAPRCFPAGSGRWLPFR